MPHYSQHIKHWKIDQEITFLNHGSFGATPAKILELQTEYRNRLEAEPVRFMVREYEPLWDQSRKTMSGFLGCKAHSLVFVKNATMGVNTILHALEFNPGDEILTTSHAYGACVNTLRWYCEKNKLKLVIAAVPFPLKGDDDVLSAIEKSVTPKTKFALIDHITSATGTIFPVKKITSFLKKKNIEVLIDGAHAPGMVDLNIEEIGADYFTGNCHKWICSPKGSAVLWVSEEHHHKISPLQISHTYDRPEFRKELWAKSFFWPGTDDYTAWLCVPEAKLFMQNIFPGGWNELRNYNRNLVLRGRKLLAETAGTALPNPDEMIGSIANILLGDAPPPEYGFNYISAIQETLFSNYKIEVPVFVYPKENSKLWLRISAQAYTDYSQYEYLADVLQKELKLH